MRLLPFEYAVRNLGRSPVRFGLAMAGALLVVLLVISAAAFVRGMERSLKVSAGASNVILLNAGSEESLERSETSPTVPSLLQASVPGIKTRLGVPYISPEVVMQANLSLSVERDGHMPTLLRGVTPAAFLVHEKARIVSGRLPTAGRDEVLVGSMAAKRMGLQESVLAEGQKLYFDHRPWTIVGHFESPGTVLETEVWMPLSDLQIFARRDNLSCVVVTLDTATFDEVDAFARRRLDLELVAIREADYYKGISAFYRPIQVMVWVTAVLIAVGGLFGGLNTMYAAFASRTRETGMLQTLGFPRRAVVVSMIQESALATAVGALAACGVALLLLDGVAVRFSMGAFGLVVDAPVLLTGMLSGVALGFIGALPPAYACLRLPITGALKAT